MKYLCLAYGSAEDWKELSVEIRPITVMNAASFEEEK